MNKNTRRQSMEFRSRLFVSLTTDYGYQSEGVGVMKGTILTHEPAATIVDLSHAVSPGSVINGERIFEAIRFLPVGVHLCVVDPGVGTPRRAVGVLTGRGDILIGPDNGVMRHAIRNLGGVRAAHQLDTKLETGSCVFDGRDVFAHCAGLVIAGSRSLEDLGPAVGEQDLAPPSFSDYDLSSETLAVIALHVNRFGNVILNVAADGLSDVQGRFFTVSCHGAQIVAEVAPSFGHVGLGEPVLCDDGFGRVCVAFNHASASDALGIRIGDHVELRPRGMS